MIRRTPLHSVLLGLVVFMTSPAAGAQESDDLNEPVAIQERKFVMAHEFRMAAGSMPLDAFEKGWTLSLSYTAHLSDYWAWEVIQATGALLLVSTNLRNQLVDTFAVPQEDFAAPRAMVTTGLELSPFYGKQAFMNDDIVHQGFLFGAYGGVILGDRSDFADTLSDLRPTVGVGIGYRLYLNKLVSMRGDIRSFLSFKRAIRDNEQFSAENVMLLTLSFSFNVWRDDA